MITKIQRAALKAYWAQRDAKMCPSCVRRRYGNKRANQFSRIEVGRAYVCIRCGKDWAFVNTVVPEGYRPFSFVDPDMGALSPEK